MQSPDPQFCPYCGYENNARNHFCARCARAVRTAREFLATGAESPENRCEVSCAAGIDAEPAAVAGTYWRMGAGEHAAIPCTDPVCPQCGIVNTSENCYCRCCGLIVSRDIRLDIFDEFVILRLDLEHLDFENSRILTEAFKNLNHRKRVIVDMERVQWIDSSGIGVLVTQTLRWGRYSTDIQLIGVNESVFRTIRGLQVDNVLKIGDSVKRCLHGWGLDRLDRYVS